MAYVLRKIAYPNDHDDDYHHLFEGLNIDGYFDDKIFSKFSIDQFGTVDFDEMKCFFLCSKFDPKIMVSDDFQNPQNKKTKQTINMFENPKRRRSFRKESPRISFFSIHSA